MAQKEGSSNPTIGIPSDISEGAYVGGCFAIVGGGFLGAVKYSMNKDKELFKKNKIPTMYAAKAFMYGSLLCVGTFASVGALVVFSTGISNAKDFGKAMRKLFGNRTPEHEFEKDHEIEFDNLRQDIVEFFIDNDETNQARELLIEKPNVEVVVEPEAEKPPRESPILALFKDSNGEYSKKSPVLAWLKEKRAELLGHPTSKPAAPTEEPTVDPVVVKQIIETALNEETGDSALTNNSETVNSTAPDRVDDSTAPVGVVTANRRTWMQFWSDTVYGSSSKSK